MLLELESNTLKKQTLTKLHFYHVFTLYHKIYLTKRHIKINAGHIKDINPCFYYILNLYMAFQRDSCNVSCFQQAQKNLYLPFESNRQNVPPSCMWPQSARGQAKPDMHHIRLFNNCSLHLLHYKEKGKKQYLFGGSLHLSLNESLQPHNTSSHYEKRRIKGLGKCNLQCCSVV